MPLGTEVGLGPGDTVLDGDPAAPRKKAQQPASAPLFGPCLLRPNGRPSRQLLSSCEYTTDLPDTLTLGGAYDEGGVSPVRLLRAKVICCCVR